MGVQTLISKSQLYVESQNYLNSSGSAQSALTVTASATGTYTGSDITENNIFKGIVAFIALTTVSATCTLVFNLQGKDPLSELYGNIARVSIDAVTASFTVRPITWTVYPGVTEATATLEYHHNSPIVPTIRIVASITATASAGGAAVSFTTGLTRII